MNYLADVNVWLALAAERHVHHLIIRRWFEALEGRKVLFCRLTQMGFLRLLTNKHVMQDEVMVPNEAWMVYRTLRTDFRIGYAAEPSSLPEVWHSTLQSTMTSPNVWTDSYLCAFAREAGLVLATLDAQMARAEEAICLLPTGGS